MIVTSLYAISTGYLGKGWRPIPFEFATLCVISFLIYFPEDTGEIIPSPRASSTTNRWKEGGVVCCIANPVIQHGRLSLFPNPVQKKGGDCIAFWQTSGRRDLLYLRFNHGATKKSRRCTQINANARGGGMPTRIFFQYRLNGWL